MINTNDKFKRIQLNEDNKFSNQKCDTSQKEKPVKPLSPKEIMNSMCSSNQSLLKIDHTDYTDMINCNNHAYMNHKLTATYTNKKYRINSSSTISVRV